jgi:hypothetical protein
LSNTQGAQYSITITTPLGVSTTINYTVPGAQTLTQVATAILALINAVSGFAGSTSRSTPSPSHRLRRRVTLNGYSNWSSNIYLTDTTADPGLAADLATAIAGDNTWYGLEIDSPLEGGDCRRRGVRRSEQEALRDAVERIDGAGQRRVHGRRERRAVERVPLHGHPLHGEQHEELRRARVAERSLRRLADARQRHVDVQHAPRHPRRQPHRDAERDARQQVRDRLRADAGRQHHDVSGGIANTNSAGRSGAGEFLDVRRFLDWQLAQIQIGIYSALLGPGKTPFTDKGLASLGNVVLGALQRGEQAQGLVVGSSQVSTPLANSVSSAIDRIESCAGLNWSAQLAGAVHLVVSAGTVTS